jgi:IS30 family transposase
MMPYRHIDLDERCVIKKNIASGRSLRACAELLGRSPSSISRELKRNSGKYWYRPKDADDKSKIRRKESKQRKLDKNVDLRDFVLEKLKDGFSPDSIAGRIKLEGLETMSISHESIYTWLYKEARNGSNYHKYLLGQRKKRQNRLKTNKNRLKIPNRINIDKRPAEIEGRNIFGHWEGDTVAGTAASGYLVTVVERKTRFLASGFMKNKRAETCNKAFSEAFADIPNSCIKSITFDNGLEFYYHENLKELFECDTFFADPYSPWQRGSNENANRILRRFFPKKMNFCNLTQEDIDKAVHKINSIPRKSIGYYTPYEAFFDEQSVALQT